MPATMLNYPRTVVPSPSLLRFLRNQLNSSVSSSSALQQPSQPLCKYGAQIVRYSSNQSLKKTIQPCSPSMRDAITALPGSTRSSSLQIHDNRPTYPSLSSEARSSLSIRSLFTSEQKQSWWYRWLRGSTNPRDRQLPPLASFLDASSNTMRSLKKAANEPRLRCTEFNENGNVTLVNGEFKKSELIAKYGLLPRDLRKIDSSRLPHILVRPSAILINLLHLRVLIKHDRVLVFDAYGSTDSYTQSVFMYDLEGKLKQMDSRQNGSLPYELRALEAVLISVTNALEAEFEGVRDPVVQVLRELEEDIDRDKLRYLLVYSKKLGTFEQTARLVRDALEELLEADDDLASMYLTAKAEGKQRPEDDHTEVELLLESYAKVSNEIVQEGENLVSSIRNTEEIVKAILDANRNSLMLLELRFSIWTLGLGAGTFIAALYGMNLKNFIEESDAGFFGVSAVCATISAVVLIYGFRILRSVQRVSMWGGGLGGGGGGGGAARTGLGLGPGVGTGHAHPSAYHRYMGARDIWGDANQGHHGPRGVQHQMHWDKAHAWKSAAEKAKFANTLDGGKKFKR